MAANEIHFHDTGTIFEVTVKDGTTAIDVSSASVRDFEFVKPSRERATVSASFSTSGSLAGTDGKIRWLTTASFLDEVGDWQLQVYLDMPTGNWHSDVQQFRVHRNI